jgi:hypothetical protein
VKAVIVYADESGTHDPGGNQKGSQHPTIAGFAAPPSEWSKLCVDWRAILNSYDAPYFHSRELRAAKAALEHGKEVTAKLKKNPYFGWSIDKMDKFLMILARVAGRGNKVMIAGAIKIPVFNKLKIELSVNNPNNIELGDNPYKYCFGEFFNSYHKETWHRWGDFKCPVSFFFDQHDDPEWREAVHEVFEGFKTKDHRMTEISFADKKKEPHLPLQAADLLAYNIRRHAEQSTNDTFDLDELDRALFKNLATKAAVKRYQSESRDSI